MDKSKRGMSDYRKDQSQAKNKDYFKDNFIVGQLNPNMLYMYEIVTRIAFLCNFEYTLIPME
jgi:hypothetical protein